MSEPQAELIARTRRHLLLLTLGLLVALVVGIGLTTAIAAQTALDGSVDQALETSAAAVVRGLDGELPGNSEGEVGDRAEHVPASADTFFLILDPSGAVAADPSGVTVPGLPDRAAVTAAKRGGRDLRTVSAGGVNVRLLTLPIPGNESGTPVGFVQAGFILTLHDRQSAALIGSIVLVGLAGLLAAALVTRYVTARALGPIRAAFAGERRFVADASHELRTPVALIRASAEVMEREGLVAEAGRPLAADIVAEADRLTRLVADLLTLAAGQAGPSPAPEPVELGAIVDEVVRRARPLAEEHRVRLEVTSPQNGAAEGLAVAGDRDRLAQLVLVLLDNAFRHSPPDGTVAVAARRVDGSAELTVSDQGPGVPAAERERIFEPFARVRSEGSRADGGSGLGLAIARTIVAAHDGTIRAGEAPGGGARFTVRLPLRRPES